MKHKGSFLEIVVINNGFAVYDFSRAQYSLEHDRKAIPMVVFNTKIQMLDWMRDNWEEIPAFLDIPK
jgi:hypothetical protein